MAGSHHISLAPGRDTHVWSWVMHEGVIVGREQEHGLPLPDGDLEDLQLGSLHVKAGQTLREPQLRLSAQFFSSMGRLPPLCNVAVHVGHVAA